MFHSLFYNVIIIHIFVLTFDYSNNLGKDKNSTKIGNILTKFFRIHKLKNSKGKNTEQKFHDDIQSLVNFTTIQT